jgi:hypothetical protein
MENACKMFNMNMPFGDVANWNIIQVEDLPCMGIVMKLLNILNGCVKKVYN